MTRAVVRNLLGPEKRREIVLWVVLNLTPIPLVTEVNSGPEKK